MAAAGASEIWHRGGVASAVALVRAHNSLLVVLTCAPPGAGAAADDADAALARVSTRALLETTFASDAVVASIARTRATCIRLEAVEGDADYEAFRALFPVKDVPALHVIAPDGRVLVHAAFFVSPAALVRALDFAVAKRDGTAHDNAPDLGVALHPRRPLPRTKAPAPPRRRASAAHTAATAPAAMAPAPAAPATTPPPAPAAAPGTDEARTLPSADRALKLGAASAAAAADARLLARLPDGHVAQHTFPGNTLLRAVREWAAEEAGLRAEETRISVMFPRRVFDGGDFPKPIEELGLVPSATLIVAREAAPPSAVGGVLASVQAGGSYIRNAFGVAGSFFSSFVGGGPPPSEGDDGADGAARR